MKTTQVRDITVNRGTNDQSVAGTGEEQRPNGPAADFDDLVELLGRSLENRVPASAVAQCLATAVAQLDGSVHSQDLPEMAFQLAMIRLATAGDIWNADRTEPVPSS
jgi:hypothetical protein